MYAKLWDCVDTELAFSCDLRVLWQVMGFQVHLVQRIAFGLSFNLNLQSQSAWSLFKGMWQKRPREINHRLRFEDEERTLQMQ